jgi:NADH:ubiquinone oxidoreductase subunit 2 (subunit N)
MECSRIVIFGSLISVILLVGISFLFGNANITGYAVTAEQLDNIRFNPIYIFGALGLVALTCLAARVYFKRYDTQN